MSYESTLTDPSPHNWDADRGVVRGVLWHSPERGWLVTGAIGHHTYDARGWVHCGQSTFDASNEILSESVTFTGKHAQKGDSVLGDTMVSIRCIIGGKIYKARGFVNQVIRLYPMK